MSHAHTFGWGLLVCVLATAIGCGEDNVRPGQGPDSGADGGASSCCDPLPILDGGPDALSPSADGGSDAASGTNQPDAGPTGCADGESRYEPGCGQTTPTDTRALPESGCYTPCSGSNDTSCPDGTQCERAWVDPCVCPAGAPCCDACGNEEWLCLAPKTDHQRTPYEGRCARSRDDSCETDADCTTGGCGNELCHNPDSANVGTTCDCTAPAAECGCVDGTCMWYE